jgi:hypothetical protein
MNEKNQSTEAVECPHCGKVLGLPHGPMVSALMDGTGPTDVPVACPSCGRFIRSEDVTPPAGTAGRPRTAAPLEMESAEKQVAAGTWPPDVCWFCETRPAEEHAALVATLTRKKKMVQGPDGVSRQVQVTQVPVPRCAQCKRTHFFRKVIPWVCAPVLPVIMLGGTIVVWTKVLDVVSLSVPDRLFQCGGLVIFVVSAALAMGVYVLLWRGLKKMLIPDDKQIKDKFLKRYYPAVRELESSGWSLQP